MSEYKIKQIGNGWLLIGPLDAELPAAGEETLFAPNLIILCDVLAAWQKQGYGEAVNTYRKKMGEK